MLSWIREKFGTVVIGGIISFIAFVFVFYGVFSPKSTRGLHEGAVAGTVNGDAISIAEFNRELNQRMEYFKKLGGGKITDEQLKSFRLRESVFQDLASRKLMLQEARREGLSASDEEVKEKIRLIPAFQKDGKFDVSVYKRTLEVNQYTPVSFERLMGDDVSVQQWDRYFQDRIHVSEEEVKREFKFSSEKRSLKYVVLSSESAKKGIHVEEAEVKKLLADPSKMNLVKMKFEAGKDLAFKGQTLDVAKDSIARNILAGEKMDEIQKLNSGLATQVVALMKADKASEGRINSLLKPYGIKVESSGWVTRQDARLPGVGDAKEFVADAFKEKSPIDLKAGGSAKQYLMAGRILVGVVTDSQKADLSQLSSQSLSLTRKIAMRKVRHFQEDWMKKLSSRAKIDTNPSVIGATEAL